MADYRPILSDGKVFYQKNARTLVCTDLSGDNRTLLTLPDVKNIRLGYDGQTFFMYDLSAHQTFYTATLEQPPFQQVPMPALDKAPPYANAVYDHGTVWLIQGNTFRIVLPEDRQTDVCTRENSFTALQRDGSRGIAFSPDADRLSFTMIAVG